ncbi:solute carrier family 12 member 8-like isoform X1 [Anneissia japonica]|uniref:solute carrier family 12 member 8-like isoform X1 n=1 Tax=Anneissia japonica TaxID=1529436 RepID=UPI001425ABF0|nr:solute carrier family 12 member 8-like isoform X1 [Anneissia japonica]
MAENTAQEGETAKLMTAKRDSTKNIEWSRFGLAEDYKGSKNNADGDTYQQTSGQHGEKIQEIFDEHQSGTGHKPWWKANFFIKEPVLFGTWDGVFTSCMINIFGVVIFLRTGWMVGNAGIGLSVLIIFITVIVALVAALSAIGICERCKIQSGGVYFLLSHVLGSRMGGTLGIMYAFGQTVACALYCTGFGESVSETLNWDNTWAVRGVGIGTILLLLAVNIAGVKWVIKMQLILLAILCVATLDFVVGTFTHSDAANGFLGIGSKTFKNNTGSSYMPGENFFTVFGVFFPTATGVMAGINMSGDLKKPHKNIPHGTLSAIAVTTIMYLAFSLLLGATCTRYALQNDYMIAEKVSLVGFLWLLGLYISSLSSCLGGLYGAPRILQCIANENVIPIIKFMGHGKGPNKEPVIAQLLVCFVAILFIFVGHVNQLGPIVTMPFMLTYAGVDYAYFALAMSYDKKKLEKTQKKMSEKQESFLSHLIDKNKDEQVVLPNGYGTMKNEEEEEEEEEEEITNSSSPLRTKEELRSQDEKSDKEPSDTGDKKALLDEDKDVDDKQDPPRPFTSEIHRMPESWYSHLCNRWVSLFGVMCCVVIMFCIQWSYALVNISISLLIFVYIGQANPGVYPGIADFNFFRWLQFSCQRLCRSTPLPADQMVVTPVMGKMGTSTTQLTEDSEDYATRGRYHHTSVLKHDNFDDSFETQKLLVDTMEKE